MYGLAFDILIAANNNTGVGIEITAVCFYIFQKKYHAGGNCSTSFEILP